MIPARGRPRKVASTVATSLFCCHGSCDSNSSRLEPGIKLVAFPLPCKAFRDFKRSDHSSKQCKECSKCMKWMHLCKRDDAKFQTLDDLIRRRTFICSKHFADPSGPTEAFPDPFPADMNPDKQKKICSRRPAPKERLFTVPTKRQRCGSSNNEVPEIAILEVDGQSIIEIDADVIQEIIVPQVDTATATATATEADLDRLNIRELCMILFDSGWNISYQEDILTAAILHASVVTVSCSIHRNSEVEIAVLGKPLASTHKVWSNLSGKTHSNAEAIKLLNHLKNDFKVCSGYKNCKDVEMFASKEVGYSMGYFDKLTYSIRHNNCTLLSETTVCFNCKKCCSAVSSAAVRKKQMDEECGKRNIMKMNNRYLTQPELQEKASEQQKELKRTKSRLGRQEAKIISLIQERGVIVTEEDNRDLKDLLSQAEGKDNDSFKGLVFREQLKAAKVRSATGYRWHPSIIKWCLYLLQKSSSTYDALRKSGVLILPSKKTLYNYKDITRVEAGFHEGCQQRIVDLIKNYGTFEHHHLFIALLFDEMKICENLVYKKSTGELIGFVEMTDFEDSLSALQRESQNISNLEPVATHVLQLMVRGLTTKIHEPFAYFPVTTTKGSTLYTIMWEAVERLEESGLMMLAFVSDGAKPNRQFYQLSAAPECKYPYYCRNPYADTDRNIYFVCDVPHLLKTARNCLANSGMNKNTRLMWNKEKFIEWRHIVDAYGKDLNSSFRILHKLTDEHIFPTAASAMRVKLAVQVLSQSTSIAVEKLVGEQASETAYFLHMFNRFFDMMNGRHLYEGVQTRNPDVLPFTRTDDERLQWLQKDFLGYLDDWERNVAEREGDFTKAQRNKMIISSETMEGLHVTVDAVVGIIKFMLSEGAEYVLTGKLNQDPVEMEFGYQRGSAGTNANPTVLRYGENTAKLRSIRDCSVYGKGNTTCK